ncbi:serine/threonine-protein kinase [Luteimonas sp. 3794]|uniref:serine/threonine-protein kinase n=1 Tax=Luteimonas sp. 3794 TaxID=2817730 RepID=UPI0028585C7D|nr:serine/threonine-protein kinase [Luteimonas sp. 3794]MDR6993145.1 serine/threonine-protein kinase [Luteimonas sp. 3794]
MDSTRWQRLSPALDALLELDADGRAASLATLRQGDPDFAAELEALLALEADREDFLAEPIVAALSGMLPGRHVGPYELERLLGEGGMGQVWLARRADGLYERRVALKLLRPGLADPDLRLRFTRERQILARLEHPHIARLLDAGISIDQQPYLALDYIDGEPVTDWCRRHQPGVADRIRLFLQVCDAVSHAHTNLIVHRDLKPSNILVTALDDVRLLDFGIAKLLDTAGQASEATRTGLRAFTLHYAAPEQIRGEPVTTMTDVYSLGVVLYELLAGRKPYQPARASDAQWEQAILDADPPRPSQALLRGTEDGVEPVQRRRMARAIAGDLDTIVLRALAKAPADRYASVEAFALDLRRWREGRPILARPQRLSYRVGRYLRRHRWAVSSATLVALTLVASMVAVTWQANQAIEESARAQAMQDFVVGLFEQAGASAGGAPLDIRQLLEAGVQRGDAELAHQPVARAELYGVIARLRLGLGDYEQALALLERQSMLVRGMPDPPPSLRLQSASDHGRTLRLLGRPRDAIAWMQPQQSLALQREQVLPRQAAELYTQLGRGRRDIGEPDTARLLFRRALALRRDSPVPDEAGTIESLADLASLHSAAGEITAALAATDDTLARLRQRLDARHPLAVELLRTRCALLRADGRTRPAEASCREALALALDLHGARHPATLDARRQLAALHVDQGRFAEADAEFRDALVWTVARLGARHADVARIHNSLGIVAWERGDEAAALESLARTVDIWRQTSPNALLADGLFNHAMVLHAAGRDAEAHPLLLESLALRQARFGARHGLVGDTLRMLGEVDAALAPGTGSPRLDAAAAITTAAYGPQHPNTLRAVLSRARVAAEAGNRDALAGLDRLAHTPPDDNELRKIAWIARAHAAALRCGTAGATNARNDLAVLAAQVRAAQPEGGVISREIDAARQRCGALLARR